MLMFLVTKEWQNPKYSLVFFWPFKHSVLPSSGLFLALFGILFKFSSGNPGDKMGKCRATFAI